MCSRPTELFNPTFDSSRNLPVFSKNAPEASTRRLFVWKNQRSRIQVLRCWAASYRARLHDPSDVRETPGPILYPIKETENFQPNVENFPYESPKIANQHKFFTFLVCAN